MRHRLIISLNYSTFPFVYVHGALVLSHLHRYLYVDLSHSPIAIVAVLVTYPHFTTMLSHAINLTRFE